MCSEIFCAPVKMPKCYSFLSVDAYSTILAQSCVLMFIEALSHCLSWHSLLMTLWRSDLADVPGLSLQVSLQITSGMSGWCYHKHSLCLGVLGARVHGQQECTSPTPGLCFQSPSGFQALSACGAILDHCHLQLVLIMLYLMCLFKMFTAAVAVGAGPRGTRLCTNGPTVKLHVCQPGTGNAEQSHCKCAGWTTIAVTTTWYISEQILGCKAWGCCLTKLYMCSPVQHSCSHFKLSTSLLLQLISDSRAVRPKLIDQWSVQTAVVLLSWRDHAVQTSACVSWISRGAAWDNVKQTPAEILEKRGAV